MPLERFWAANHQASFSQSTVTVNFPHKKHEKWRPCFLHKLQHRNGAKDSLILEKKQKTPKIHNHNDTLSLMSRDVSCSQMRQVTSFEF